MTAEDEFQKGFKRTVRWTLFTAGAIIVLIGVLGILSLMFLAISPSRVLGLGLIVSGLNYFVPYISLRKARLRPKWFLVLAAVDAVFGMLFLTRLGLFLFNNKFPILVGLWMVFLGCARIYMAYCNYKAKIPCWWITLTVCGYAVFAAATVMNSSDPLRPLSLPLLSWGAFVMTGMFIVNEGRKLFGK
ncbi:MAG: DUF308 domain-containing protein [Synergistaceae bacterium]|jgi:uncharacterized membrane protein HdeD (DUF308 family)|nr:DUF308 domain-containing protein [Synergistaceae bacterium]